MKKIFLALMAIAFTAATFGQDIVNNNKPVKVGFLKRTFGRKDYSGEKLTAVVVNSESVGTKPQQPACIMQQPFGDLDRPTMPGTNPEMDRTVRYERYEPQQPVTVTQPCPANTLTNSNTNVVWIDLGKFAPATPPKPQPLYKGEGRKEWRKPAQVPNCCSKIWDIRREMDSISERLWRLENPLVLPDQNFDSGNGGGKDGADLPGKNPGQSRAGVGGNGNIDMAIPFLIMLLILLAGYIFYLLSKKKAPAESAADGDVKIIEALKSSGGFYHKYADGAVKIDMQKAPKDDPKTPSMKAAPKKEAAPAATAPDAAEVKPATEASDTPAETKPAESKGDEPVAAK